MSKTLRNTLFFISLLISFLAGAENTHSVGTDQAPPLTWRLGPDHSDICLPHKQAIERAQAQRQSVNSLLRRAAQSDLVFLGESHFEGDRIRHYRDYLRTLRAADSRFNCLFVEGDTDSPTGQQLLRCNQDRSQLNAALFSSNERSACPVEYNLWNALQNEAYQQGIKVIPVDNLSGCMRLENTIEAAAAINNCRDASMQANIQRHFESGECTKGVSINGAPHITSIFQGHDHVLGQQSFTGRNGQNLDVFRINIVFDSGGDNSNRIDPRWDLADWLHSSNIFMPQRRMCTDEQRPRRVRENYGFMNTALGVSELPYVHYRDGAHGNWLDFDATIVIGQ